MAVRIAHWLLSTGQTLALYHGDLTEESVEVIVNAANAQLAHGGGVAGAIARRGGPEIQRASTLWVRQHGPASHDRPALTEAGRLACKAVIHAVGPVWGSGDEDRKLRAAYIAALELAFQNGYRSIAFPSISTGIFGFPVARGAALAVQAVLDFCAAHPAAPPREIRFTLMDAPTVEVFRLEFERRRW